MRIGNQLADFLFAQSTTLFFIMMIILYTWMNVDESKLWCYNGNKSVESLILRAPPQKKID